MKYCQQLALVAAVSMVAWANPAFAGVTTITYVGPDGKERPYLEQRMSDQDHIYFYHCSNSSAESCTLIISDDGKSEFTIADLDKLSQSQLLAISGKGASVAISVAVVGGLAWKIYRPGRRLLNIPVAILKGVWNHPKLTFVAVAAGAWAIYPEQTGEVGKKALEYSPNLSEQFSTPEGREAYIEDTTDQASALIDMATELGGRAMVEGPELANSALEKGEALVEENMGLLDYINPWLNAKHRQALTIVKERAEEPIQLPLPDSMSDRSFFEVDVENVEVFIRQLRHGLNVQYLN